MKKSGRATFLIVLVLILSLLVFVACDDKGASPNEPNVPNTPNVPNGDNSQSQQGAAIIKTTTPKGLCSKPIPLWMVLLRLSDTMALTMKLSFRPNMKVMQLHALGKVHFKEFSD